MPSRSSGRTQTRRGIADAPDLKSCSAFGATPEEAVSELRVAMAAWIEAAKANGMPLPEPLFRQALPAAE